MIDAIAVRVTEMIHPLPPDALPASPWLDLAGACSYLGFSRDALYKLTAAGAIPSRKKVGGQGLRFHRAELDAWMEEAFPRVDRARA